MSLHPETRQSLLLRLRDRDDQQAWSEFFEIYEPLIYRLARAKGFQDADAREITQDVLMAVSRSISRFRKADHAGGFRGWLATITRNLAINRLRGRNLTSLDESVAAKRLEELVCVDEHNHDEVRFEQEHRKQVFVWAADQLRSRYSQANWLAFWKTCVEGATVAEVAKELNVSPGTVYVARCRIIARLREIVEQQTAGESPL